MSNSPRFDVVVWVRSNTWWMKGAAVVLTTCGSAWGALFWAQYAQGQAIADIQKELPQIKQQIIDQRSDLVTNQTGIARDLAAWRDETARRDRQALQQLNKIVQDLGVVMGRTERGGYTPPPSRPSYGDSGRGNGG